MSFSGILNGNFVVWHENVAQIDTKLTPQLSQLNKVDVVMGVNRYNESPHIKLYYKSSTTGSYIYLTTLTSITPPTIPSDGTFVEATYSAAFSNRTATDIRIIITKDGTVPQELTPVKKYVIYNNGTPITGGFQHATNDRGWQTGKVFKTIFKYLEAPISTEHRIDLETESDGILPEARIRNDGLLARVADNEIITGAWSFENGQIIVEKGAELPTNTPIEAGRLFHNTSTNYLYIGNGTGWARLIQENELIDKPDFVWGFTHSALVPPGGFLMFGNASLSLAEGMPIASNCKLTTIIARVSDPIYDDSGFDIIKNGIVVYSLPIANGTKQAQVDSIEIKFNLNDTVSVRAKPDNISDLNFPRLTLAFRSAQIPY